MSNGPPGGWPRPRSGFTEWSEQIDPELRQLFQFPGRWVLAVLGYSIGIAAISAIPGLRDFFRIDPVPVVAAQLLALAITVAIYQHENRHPLPPRARGVGVLVVGFFLQLVFSTTVACSNPPGTYVFAALPLMAIWLHVAAIGGSWRHPYPQLAHGAGMLVGYSLNPDSAHFEVFATIIPLGLVGSFISGSLTAEHGGQQAALASHRSAIGAQVLAGRRKDIDTLSGDLARAQTLRKEMAEALRAALARADRVVEDARSEVPATLLRSELAGLEGALRVLAKASQSIRALGREVPPSSEGARPVDAFRRARRRSPRSRRASRTSRSPLRRRPAGAALARRRGRRRRGLRAPRRDRPRERVRRQGARRLARRAPHRRRARPPPRHDRGERRRPGLPGRAPRRADQALRLHEGRPEWPRPLHGRASRARERRLPAPRERGRSRRASDGLPAAGAVVRTGLMGLEEWAEGFDPELRSGRFWMRTLLVSSFATVVFVLLAQLPPLRGFFGLRPHLPIALVALRLAAYAAFIRYEMRRGVSPTYFAAGAFGMAFTFQLVVSSLVVSAEPPGAFVLAVLPVVGAAYNTMVLHGTPRFPWPALVHAAAIGILLAARPAAPYWQIFAVAGPLAVGSGLFLGVVSESMARSRRLLEEHRRAIEASALEERSDEARRLSSTLLEILQWSHDASSALSAALLDSEYLADLIRRGDSNDPKAILSAARSLRDALRRMAYDPADAARAAGDPALDAALVLPAIRAAFGDVARRYPAVAFEAEPASPEEEFAEATLRGGGTELERIIAELAKNACEGNGVWGASRVAAEVDTQCEPGFVHVRVADDGPGFSNPIGDAPTPFLTTKAEGSGLGLFTAAGVLRASGGSLTLANRPGGGAVVTLRLPRR